MLKVFNVRGYTLPLILGCNLKSFFFSLSIGHELAKQQRKNFGEDITGAIKYAKRMVSACVFFLITYQMFVINRDGKLWKRRGCKKAASFTPSSVTY